MKVKKADEYKYVAAANPLGSAERAGQQHGQQDAADHGDGPARSDAHRVERRILLPLGARADGKAQPHPTHPSHWNGSGTGWRRPRGMGKTVDSSRKRRIDSWVVSCPMALK